ncbi:hypothetical protein FRC12_011084 [Ceratobasidium sp. 428]|nr:hypothetical protein FRC12_011084 [Ceratobasidium sp. 428]
MGILDKIRLRLTVFLLRSNIRVASLFRGLFGTRPYYTHFPPNRSFGIKSSTSSRNIKINVYEPTNFDKGKTYPVYLNFHSSGFMIPSLGMDGDFCRIVSNRTGAIVLDCDYAKAPEYPFPAAPDDVRDAISHVLDNQGGYYDTSRLAAGGFSAGAALALTAVTAQPKGTVKGRAIPHLIVVFRLITLASGIIAFYPPADFSLDHADRPQPDVPKEEQNPLSTPSFMKLVQDCYCPPGTDLSDPRLSPINVPLSCFPKHVFIAVCGYDPLRNEAVTLAEKLKQGGIDVAFHDLPKVAHAWDKEAKEKTHGGVARHNSYEAAVEMLKLVFGSN